MSVLLSCNGLVLNHATILCDRWYTSTKEMDSFVQKGFYTIGALKTNRVIYPCGLRQKISAFALHLRKTDSAVRLVTAGSCQYDVYLYEGSLNDIEDAVVLLKMPF